MTSNARIAKDNIEAAFPGISDREVRRIIAGMWRNIGCIVGELPHVHDIGARYPGRVRIVSYLGPGKTLPTDGPIIVVSAHYGNFELAGLPAERAGVDLTTLHRPLSNPLTNEILQSLRAKRGYAWVPRDRRGIRMLLSAIRRGGSVAVLMDRRFRGGIPVPLFGRDALTTTTFAKLALKHGLPIVPVRVVREPHAHFRIEVCRPIAVRPTGDAKADVRAVVAAINGVFEDWIRDRPDLWWWHHRRWLE